MNDLFFMAKNKKGLQDKSLSQKVYIIRHEVAEYHQCEALYIIKPQERYSPKGADEIQGRFAALDDMHRTSRGDDIPSLRL